MPLHIHIDAKNRHCERNAVERGNLCVNSYNDGLDYPTLSEFPFGVEYQSILREKYITIPKITASPILPNSNE